MNLFSSLFLISPFFFFFFFSLTLLIRVSVGFILIGKCAVEQWSKHRTWEPLLRQQYQTNQKDKQTTLTGHIILQTSHRPQFIPTITVTFFPTLRPPFTSQHVQKEARLRPLRRLQRSVAAGEATFDVLCARGQPRSRLACNSELRENWAPRNFKVESLAASAVRSFL